MNMNIMRLLNVKKNLTRFLKYCLSVALLEMSMFISEITKKENLLNIVIVFLRSIPGKG